MTLRIAPSILSADFGKLAVEVAEVLDAGADWIHVDVMDGQFVPNITIGPLVVKALRQSFDCYLDVHLMIVQPERYIEDFAEAGASSITIHAEATPHAHRALQQIRRSGLHAGLALNPGTGIDGLAPLADEIDLLLLMTVNPGFGGQAFIPAVTKKIVEARKLLDDLGRGHVPIQVDGGISAATIRQVVQAGATNCVAGSAVFAADNRRQAIAELRRAADSAN